MHGFNPDGIQVIAFDADDTLWQNEIHYQESERQFCALLEPWLTERETKKELFKTEMETLSLYGFGAKGFMLAMISTAIRVSDGQVSNQLIEQIVQIGHGLINAPLVLLADVAEVLEHLHGKYRMVVATKGDLLDQERKLVNSNLAKYFHHVEIMSDKHEDNYIKLVQHLDIDPQQFLMIGNSLKSDVVPVLNINAQAIHIPFHLSWQHEHVADTSNIRAYLTLESFRDLPALLDPDMR